MRPALMLRRVLDRAAIVAAAIALIPAAAADAAPFTWSAPVGVAGGKRLNGIACAGRGLCVAVGDGGQAVVSTNPTGGAGSWTANHIDGTNRLIAISCPTLKLCVATDNRSRVLVSTNPSSPGSWKAALIDPGRWLSAVSCPTTKLCVVADRYGGVVSSTNPTGGARAWKRVQVAVILDSISCPSAKLCVATVGDDRVIESTSPAGGASGWHLRKVTAGTVPQIAGVACPNVKLCVAAGFEITDFDAWITTKPTANKRWTLNSIDSLPHVGTLTGTLACGSPMLCVAVVNEGSPPGQLNPYVSTNAGKAWKLDFIPSMAPTSFMGVACAGTSLCVIVDDGGNVVVGT